jgi:tripartite-type tricarboxylate transporter receptor subunit TctC
MTTMDRRHFGLGLMAGLGLGALAPRRAAAAQWTPRRPIEFVIMAGRGDGADRLARKIITIIEKHGLSDQPIVPVNKDGRSGGEALDYLADKAGNPHVVMATLNSLFTTPLRNAGVRADVTTLTPIASMAIDSFVLWVNAETDIMTLDDYVAAAREAGPDNWRMGGTGLGQEDSLVTEMLEQATGVKHSYLRFQDGAAAAKSLVAQQVEATVSNPAEQMDFYAAGKSRPLAAFTPLRLGAIPEVPTFRELGHDLVYHSQRSVVAPGGLPDGAKGFYEKLFWKVNASAEWRIYADSKALYRHWLTGRMLRDYLYAELAAHREILKARAELG